MSENIQLREPVYKLVIRFSNGEAVHYVVNDPIEAHTITPETKYAVINCISLQDPTQCTDTTVFNLKDVTFIKTQRVTLDELAGERRTAGIRSGIAAGTDDRLPKSIATLKFI